MQKVMKKDVTPTRIAAMRIPVLVVALATVAATAAAQTSSAPPDWARIEQETMRHFQALLRFDTADLDRFVDAGRVDAVGIRLTPFGARYRT